MQAIAKEFHPEIVRIESEGFPTAGTYRGVAEVQEHVGAIAPHHGPESAAGSLRRGLAAWRNQALREVLTAGSASIFLNLLELGQVSDPRKVRHRISIQQLKNRFKRGTSLRFVRYDPFLARRFDSAIT